MPFAPLARVATIIILPMLVVSGFLLHPGFGQDGEIAGDLQESHQLDPINFKGRVEFEISDASQVPRQIARAAIQSGCNYRVALNEEPLRFLSLEGRRFVLLYCWGIVGTHQVFDLADVRRPQRVEFPFVAQDAGLGTTPRPGYLVWRKDVGVFEAVTGTDTCPSSRLRHVYRLGTTEGGATSAPTFVLVRVDVMEVGCGQDGAWSPAWEAPTWPKTTVVR
jgi:hypothetical protein